MLISSKNPLIEISRRMFDHISRHHDPVMLTHKNNHYTPVKKVNEGMKEKKVLGFTITIAFE